MTSVDPHGAGEAPRPPLGGRGRGAWADRAAAAGITSAAWLAILSLVLIFVFIGKEAVPIFTSAEVREEADLGRLFLPQPPKPGEEAAFAWQPVSEIPKYSLSPSWSARSRRRPSRSSSPSPSPSWPRSSPRSSPRRGRGR